MNDRRTLVKLFETQARRNPNRLALTYRNTELSYEELNSKANQLAHHIESRYKLKKEDLVALFLDKNEKMPISILAALKISTGYVPIDVNCKNERLNFLLLDSSPKIIITNEKHECKLKKAINSLPKNIRPSLLVLEKVEGNLSNLPISNPKTSPNNNTLAYVIYTSGTTGNPKGVMVEHSSVVNTLESQLSYLNIKKLTETKKFGLVTNYVFDASVSGIFLPLISGNTLVISDDILKINLNEFIRSEHINIMILSSPLINLLDDFGVSLETIIIGGETPNISDIEKLTGFGVEVFQEYGLTETSIANTFKKLEETTSVNNIGRPLKNTILFVLDETLKPCTIGEEGELYIGGVGVSRGYLNNPTLTQEKFIRNPFQTEGEKKLGENEILYRTGDLVKLNKNGDLKYCGRNDFQIKIRGQRIELGEIENTLNKYPGVKQSVVVYLNTNNSSSYLAAYYVSGKTLDEIAILEFLESHFPKHMIPSAIMKINSMPLTPNGKIDRYALPQPILLKKENYLAPRTNEESKMTEVWSETLDLPVEKIGIKDDFFSLGGNSLLAIQLINSIKKKLNLDIEISDIFQLRIIEALANKSLVYDGNSLIRSRKKINKNSQEETSLSENMILRDYYSSEFKNTYNESFVLELKQPVDFKKMASAVNALLSEFPILNSNYSEANGSFYRKVNDGLIAESYYFDLSNHTKKEERFSEQINTLVKKKFNIEKERLIRFYLFKFSENNYKLLTVFFHAILDGTSIVNILLPRFSELLSSKDEKVFHPKKQNSFEDFCSFKDEIKEIYNANLEKKLDYWSGFLAEMDPCPINDLPGNPSNNSGSQETFTLGHETKNTLVNCANKLGVSLFDLLLGSFLLLLNKFTGQSNLAIKTNVDERLYAPKFAHTLGCFINNLFLGTTIEEDNPLKDLFIKTRENKEDGISNLISYEDMLDKFREKVIGLSTIHFNVEPEELEINKNQQSQLYTHSGEVKNNLYFELDIKNNNILGRVEYKTQLFSSYFIKKLIACYKNIIENIVTLLDTPIREINLLSKEEYAKVIYEFNKTEKPFSSEKTITQLFEEQVSRTPNHIAVTYENQKITYQQLNHRANQLAHYLVRKNKTKPDDLIPILMERSEYLLSTILGVLKAGAAYVPVDPNFPDERIQYILEDTKNTVILTDATHLNKLSNLAKKEVEIIAINDGAFQQHLTEEKTENFSNAATSNNLAYVIYTSGTTGKPKGAMLEHKGIVNRIQWMNEKYPINDKDKILQKTPYVFDVSVWELFWAIWYGSSIVFAKPDGHKDINYLIDLINKESISVVHFVPSMLNVFENALEETNSNTTLFSSLRYIFCSGEALSLTQVKKAHQLLPHVELHNLYGPTEASVDVLYYPCVDRSINTVLIGKPIDNTQAYILDKNLIPLPIGGIGELYLGGIGLARGYLNRPDLTMERFIENPLQTSSKKLYKTGDLARWLENGNIEYLGRNDFQVKIRGFRVELGEIESALLGYPGIKQSVVIAKTREKFNSPNDGKYLCAYYLADNPINEKEILQDLAKKLPDYMMPSTLIHLEKLPLTTNGKLDNHALPEPIFASEINHIPPRNKLEERVHAIWAESLNLPLKSLSIHDDFFRIGGDSISAIQLVSQLRRQLNLTVSIQDIFTYKNIESLYDQVIQKQASTTRTKSGQPNKTLKLKKITPPFLETGETYLANTLQQGFVYHFLKQGDFDDAYRVQVILEYQNRFDIIQLKEAWRYAQKKYPALRLRFSWEDEIKQIIDDEGVFNWQYSDISDIGSISEQKVEIEKICEKDREQGYDLEKASLFRLTLIKQSETLYTFIFSNHHAILDGWSVPVLLEYVHTTYTQLLANKKIQVEKETAYTNTQMYLQNNLDENKEYWEKYLSKIEDTCDLRGLLSFKARNTRINEYNHITLSLEKDFLIQENLYDQLKNFSKKYGVTLNSILQYAWHRTLSIYSNSQQTIVGSVVSGRNLPIDNIEKSVGLFINTLPVIVNHQEASNVIDTITQLQKNINEANQRSNINLAKIQKNNQRLFDSIFVYENYPASKAEFNKEILNVSFKGAIEKLDYPLALIAYEMGQKNTLTLKLRYASELFDSDRINDLLEILSTTIFEIISTLTSKAQELKFLTNSTEQKILSDLNAQKKLYPSDNTIVTLFEAQASKIPHNIALAFDGKYFTYADLNQKANRLARHLIEDFGIKPNDLIGLCLNRSETMIISILAALKTGAAYVPMDPSYPNERLQYIARDSNPKLIISHEKDAAGFATRPIVAIDKTSLAQELKNFSGENLDLDLSSKNLAYVIYTSGTTGKPKGVLQPHSNVVRLFSATKDWYQFNEKDTWTLFHSYVFDFSVWEIWGALLHGGKLVIPSYEQTRDLNLFYQLCQKEEVTVLNQTPTAFYQLMDVAISQHPKQPLTKLRYIIFGGEALNLTQIKPWFERYDYQKPLLVNMYGITETTVHVTYQPITQELLGNSSYIGKVIPDLTAYVLDRQLRPLPIGAIGELYIGGAGLAKGYLNRPELTNERFITNPFHNIKNLQENNLYKTGDLVRWLKDGSLEYIGRNDHQVKIRGHRIELGEIENTLSSFPGIKQSVVLAKEHKNQVTENKYLVAYYLSDNTIAEEALLKHLNARLPSYMVPSIFKKLAHFPLTVNGKLDTRALPEVTFKSSNHYVAPRNEIEVSVCKIWSDLLNIGNEKLSIRDDFFSLGGDSITSIQLISRLRQQLALIANVKDIFTYKTIETLYDNVLIKQTLNNSQKLKAEQGRLSSGLPLLPIQEWFFTLDLENIHYWNQAFTIQTPILDISQLITSLKKLINHHDAFSLRFSKTDKISQYYDENAKPEALKILDISQLTEKEIDKALTNWQSQFNIEKGPTYAMAYLHGYPNNTAKIFFAFHHLIVDSVSWRILAEDLKRLYLGEELPSKGSSYRQWSKTIQEYTKSHQNEKNYWNETLADYSPQKLNKLIESKSTQRSIEISLSKENTQKLLYQSNQAFHTQINDILLTALGLSLAELTKNNTNHIVLEGHGREELDNSIDITKTMGWFTTLYPVRLQVSACLKDSLRQVKDNLRRIPNKGIGFGALIGYEKNLLPIVSFNYLGKFDNEIQKTWAISSENIGKTEDQRNIDHHLINMNGLIINESLKFTILSKLTKENLDKFSASFIQNLEKLVDFTSQQSRSYLTQSDIGNIITQEYLDKVQVEKEIDSIYLANNLQQGFIYHALSQGKKDEAYRVQLIWKYHNKLDISKLEAAWRSAQEKYPALRLRFSWEQEIIQIVDHLGTLNWRNIDLSKISSKREKDKLVEEIKNADRLEPYDLSKVGLFRVTLVKLAAEEYLCIFNNHHAIIDGWSIPVLFTYIHDAYQKLCGQEKIRTNKDLAYHKAQFHLQTHSPDQAYWKQYVEKLTDKPKLEALLKEDITSVNLSNYKQIKNPKKEKFFIHGEIYQQLKSLCQKHGITLSTVLQYAWHKALNVYGNSSQSIVGTTVSGRNLAIDHIESSVGLYINTIPIIVDHSEPKVLIEAIKALQDDINEANTKSNVNLSSLQNEGTRLFDSLFIYENFPSAEENSNDMNIEVLPNSTKLDYPIGLVCEENEGISIELRYAGELFSENTIIKLLKFVNRMIEQIVHDPEQNTNQLKFLSAEEYTKIILDRNNTKNLGADDTKTLIQLFEEQVKKTPEKIALTYGNTQLTYKELNQKANQLARFIRDSYQLKPDDIVALCLERNEYMFIGILASLKSGAAYVPIDINFPKERINYILEDSGAKILLTNNKNVPHLKQSPLQISNVIAIDGTFLYEEIEKQSTENLYSPITGSNLAYVIYTSGTTGKPKGVMIEHKSIVSRLIYLKKHHNITENYVFASKTSYVFDPSLREIFLPLITGARLVLLSESEYKDVNKIFTLCVQEKINFLIFVPSHFSIFIESLKNISKDMLEKLELKLIYSCGEPLTQKLVEKTFEYLPNIILKNQYGPTEACQFSFENEITKESKNTRPTAAVGHLVENMQSYVLDSNLSPLPTGVVGELYIGGLGLARGYLNQPALTKEKFINNPFQTPAEKELGESRHLYKTGDLVRWLKDGKLEFVSRNDFQVKVRGHRIELSEIEHAISSYQAIKQTVVIVKGQNLIAYYVSEHKKSEKELSVYLSATLPEYMIPQAFIHLIEMPLTLNGKVDRKSLPEHDLLSLTNYESPKNALESKFCAIYAEVLDLPENKIGTKDDFFNLGGNSLLSIKLINRIRHALDIDLDILSVFKHRTVSNLLQNIQNQPSDSKGVEIEL